MDAIVAEYWKQKQLDDAAAQGDSIVVTPPKPDDKKILRAK